VGGNGVRIMGISSGGPLDFQNNTDNSEGGLMGQFFGLIFFRCLLLWKFFCRRPWLGKTLVRCAQTHFSFIRNRYLNKNKPKYVWKCVFFHEHLRECYRRSVNCHHSSDFSVCYTFVLKFNFWGLRPQTSIFWP